MVRESVLRVVTVACVCIAFFASSTPAGAGEEKKGLSVAGGVHEALVRIGSGEKVELGLRNGQTYAGVLGLIGDQLVLIQQLRGKEFYDALVRIDDISSLEVRVRDH